MAENTLSVLKIAPGQYPQQVEIDNNLKALQEAVGGTIAAVYPFADPVAIICNDDGKLMGLPLNRALRDENGQMYDAVAGDFLVVGLGEEDFASLDLDVQVAKLKVLKADHQSQKFRLQDKLLTKFPADIQETNAHIAGLKADAQLAAAHPQVQEGFCGMTIKGVTYDEKKTAGERLVLACSELPNAEEKVIGSYRGFELSLRFDTFRSEYQALLKGQRKYTVPLGTDPLGNIIRLDNSLNSFPERITAAENELATLHQQQAAAQIEVEKPFPQEEELAEKSARLAELNAQLDVDEKSHEPEQEEEPDEDAPRRPSVLAALEEKSDKPEPVKPFRSYYDKDGDAR